MWWALASIGLCFAMSPVLLCETTEAMVEVQCLKSKSLARALYDTSRRVLEIEFRTGEIYCYSKVPKEVFDGLADAESKGQYFGKFIRGKFPFTKKESTARR